MTRSVSYAEKPYAEWTERDCLDAAEMDRWLAVSHPDPLARQEFFERSEHYRARARELGCPRPMPHLIIKMDPHEPS